MRKDKYTITKKWEKKLEEMRIKADLKFSVLLQNKKRKLEKEYDYEWEKIERKKKSYIKKKEEEYHRKMMNEIREFEWRPKKEYKTPAPKIKPLQFALDIAQENAKLRDTDADGNGYCISCDKYCTWGEMAWWHWQSRRFINICLEPENINAQCHSCNWTTGPRWDVLAKERVNEHYAKNMDKKFWAWTSDRIKKGVKEFFQGKSSRYDLDYEIPRLIEENENLWKTKNFYAPKKKWRAIWAKYTNRV